MTITMLKGKIHRATVTQAELNYVGSITVDADLLDAAVGPSHEGLHGHTGGLSHHTGGGAGAADGVFRKDAAVGDAELDHQFLLVVMGHERDIHGSDTSFLFYMARSGGRGGVGQFCGVRSASGAPAAR